MNMHFRRHKRHVPMLNTAATADMSFMLLIFFLVSSSMDTDKGLERMLPPIDDNAATAVTDINAANVLRLELTADNSVTADGQPVAAGGLRRRVATFIYSQASPADRQSPGATRHIISVSVDRRASYDAYFNMQNDIVAAYNIMRESRARAVYGRQMSDCTAEQIEELRAYYPQRIAEAYTPGR